MHSNLRLLFLGLLLGLLSALYPRLPSYLPYSIVSRLPFLSSSLLHPELSKTWQSVQRYQSTVPISKNYEDSPESKWEEEIEKQLRFGSKEGGREMEKELKRHRRELEKRTQAAGNENMIKEGLPVYYLEQDLDSAALSRVGQEINSLVPLNLVLIAPYSTSAQHLILSTASLLSHSPASKLTQSLLNSFAHHPPSGVPAVSSSLLTLPPSLESIVSSLSLDQAIRLSYIALPVPTEGDAWEKEKWWDVGEVLHELRHGDHRQKKQDEEEIEFNGETLIGGGRKRQENGNEGKRTVIVGIGRSLPSNASPSFSSLLSNILSTHTSHSRSLSLAALYSSTSGSKPTKVVPRDQVGLVVAAEAAGEGEGESLEGGKVWRFGALPIR